MLPALFALILAIDPAKSTASFSIAHVFVERVSGNVHIANGSIDVPSPGALPSKVTATLDASSFKTDDPDRDVALKGPDWFDTSRFPAWTFTSTKIAPAADGFTVDGMLTMHGVTVQERMNVKASGDAAHPRYHAVCHVDRTAFGMRKTPLDAAIGTVADVTLDIVTQ